MADFNALETLINAYIKQNGIQAITGNILNGVLRGMVDALGKGYTIVGVATPSTDPGTMTGPCAYYASTYGTYTHFDNIVVNDGEIAMLIYDEQVWHKEKMWRLDAEASIDANVGTPSVETSFEDELLTFRFHNIKGEPGDSAGFGVVNATVDSNIGTPGVSVQTSGPDTAKNMTFQFTNLKGETGVTSVVVTVDNTTGTPACAVSLNGQELHLDFTGLKGAQGNTGVSADYPIAIINNLTDGGAASALSAEMGKELATQLNQLEHKLDKIDDNFIYDYSVNLFDKTAATANRAVRKDTGGLISDSGYYASDYIYIADGVTQIAVTGGQSYGGVNGIAFYDTTKTFISGTGSYPATVPTGGKYVRVSVKATLLDTTMIVYGPTVPGTYQPYGEILDAKLKPITLDETDFSIIQRGKNLLNPALVVTNKWIAQNGTPDNVTSSYGYYDWTEVEPETAYHLSNSGGGALSNRNDAYIAFYKEDKTFISSVASDTTDITTPSLCKYVRISVVIPMTTDAQMELGAQRTTYEAYIDPYRVIDPDCIVFPDNGVTTQKIADGAVTQNKIAPGVSLPASPFPFGSFRDNDSALSYGGSLTLPLVYVAKNTRIVATIVGTIESVSVGISRLGTYGEWVEITQTKVILRSGTSGTADHEYNHGLTLGTRTIVIISKDVTASSLSSATIRVINDYGEIWSQSVTWGVVVGRAFIYNGNSSGTIAADLSFMLGDICKNIWMFGDSYFSFTDPARWLNYPMKWGFLDYLVNARGGENATEALADFNTILSLGATPSFAVWAMGMNGGADSAGAVNPTWLSVTQAFIAKCEEKGIEPILATIPSVPSDIHIKLNEWVRASGYRYIDFADAVESSTPNDYYWRGWGTANALLSNDEVHPSTKGAVELATRALQDFPEMAVCTSV